MAVYKDLQSTSWHSATACACSPSPLHFTIACARCHHPSVNICSPSCFLSGPNECVSYANRIADLVEPSPADILNFALNLEYLEAEFCAHSYSLNLPSAVRVAVLPVLKDLASVDPSTTVGSSPQTPGPSMGVEFPPTSGAATRAFQLFTGCSI